MAKARPLRPRTLAVLFGIYVAVVLGVAAYLSAPLAAYVDPGATFWISAAYVLSGAFALTGVCLGALRSAARLDARLTDLEIMRSEIPSPAKPPVAALPSMAADGAPAGPPTDEDVDELLLELREIGEAAVAAAWPRPETDAASSRAAEAAAAIRDARGREIRRIAAARDTLVATAAGPAMASIGLLGVFAALLPASNGMLIANLQLNAFFGISGGSCLVGIVAYAGAAFRGLRRRAA